MSMWLGLCLHIMNEAQTEAVLFQVRAVTIKELNYSGEISSMDAPVFITTCCHTWKEKGSLILQMSACFVSDAFAF